MDKKEVFYPIQVEFWIFSDLGVVVGFAFEDGEGAVELFGEEEAYHLVGEGHLGDGKTAVGGFVGFGGESERPADHEHEVAHACIHLAEGMPSGSFGPTTACRMDSYVDQFQAAGGSMILIAKGNRSCQTPCLQ